MALYHSHDFFEITQANSFLGRFQRRIYKNFFMSVQCKKPPFSNTMFIDDQTFANNFEKGHPRNISMRFLTSIFREDFLGICLWSYSQVAPIHQSPVHGRIKISLTIFERGHSRNISVNWGLEATYSVVLIVYILLLN